MTNQQYGNAQEERTSSPQGWEIRPPEPPNPPPMPEYIPEPERGYPPPPPYPPPYHSWPEPYYGYDRSPYQGVLAGIGQRFGALIIDSIIISIATSLFVGSFAGALSRPFGDGGFFPTTPQPSWAMTIIGWGFYAWMCYIGLNGNTIGKKVMGIKLANRDGSKPSLQTFLLHFTIGYALNAVVCCLGYIWAIFDRDKQTWGKKIFKDLTVVGTW